MAAAGETSGARSCPPGVREPPPVCAQPRRGGARVTCRRRPRVRDSNRGGERPQLMDQRRILKEMYADGGIHNDRAERDAEVVRLSLAAAGYERQ